MGKHGDTSGPQLPRSPLLALASAAKSAHPPALATTAASLGSSLLHLKAPWRTPCRCPPSACLGLRRRYCRPAAQTQGSAHFSMPSTGRGLPLPKPV